MKMVLFTLVLDGMPWIAEHYPVFRTLPFEWEWHVVEGVAAPDACTRWCAQQVPRLSEDGTTGYLDSIADLDPRIKLHRKDLWHGKVAMCNRVLQRMADRCLLVQIDSDEIWTAEQLTKLRALFIKHPKKNAAYFYCDYRLGPGISITTRNTYGNNTAYEWLRAWRWEPWMRFKTHEPPVMDGMTMNAFMHDETERLGLVFRHESWSTRKQVEFKARYYGSAANKEHGADYKDAVERWEKLQRNTVWPTKVRDWLPWADEKAEAVKR